MAPLVQLSTLLTLPNNARMKKTNFIFSPDTAAVDQNKISFTLFFIKNIRNNNVKSSAQTTGLSFPPGKEFKLRREVVGSEGRRTRWARAS